MSELLRPPPDEPWWHRVRMLVQGLSPWSIAGGAGTVLAAAVVGWWLLRPPAPPVEDSLPFAGASTTVVASATGSMPVAERALVAQVAGAVVTPGVYRVPDGSRVEDLVIAAGGPTPDGDPQRINLAARVTDGQRVYVP
ncbi:MAG TPA: SLBB domain-containing protein, partial [Acidimicrobiales bacterium]